MKSAADSAAADMRRPTDDYALKHQLKKLVSENARPSRAGNRCSAYDCHGPNAMEWRSQTGRGSDGRHYDLCFESHELGPF